MTRGFQYDPSVVETDLSRLLAYIAGSEVLARRASKDLDAYHPITHLRQAEIFDVHRILMNTAILLRERLQFSADRAAKDRSVGRLFEGGTQSELRIREACNKIIHAERVEEQRKSAIEPPSESLSEVIGGLDGRIFLHGTKGTEDWRAELDLYKFCFSAYWAL